MHLYGQVSIRAVGHRGTLMGMEADFEGLEVAVGLLVGGGEGGEEGGEEEEERRWRLVRHMLLRHDEEGDDYVLRRITTPLRREDGRRGVLGFFALGGEGSGSRHWSSGTAFYPFACF